MTRFVDGHTDDHVDGQSGGRANGRLRPPKLVPWFGGVQVVPEPVPTRDANGQKRREERRPCRHCGGKPKPCKWPYVCMGCHSCAPDYEAMLGTDRADAIKAREPQYNEVKAEADALTEGRRRPLTQFERQELVREMDAKGAESGAIVRAWLDSIGEDVPDEGEVRSYRAAHRRLCKGPSGVHRDTQAEIEALGQEFPEKDNAWLVQAMRKIFGKVISVSAARKYRRPSVNRSKGFDPCSSRS